MFAEADVTGTIDGGTHGRELGNLKVSVPRPRQSQNRHQYQKGKYDNTIALSARWLGVGLDKTYGSLASSIKITPLNSWINHTATYHNHSRHTVAFLLPCHFCDRSRMAAAQ